MSQPHHGPMYLGRKAIVERLGYKSPRVLTNLMIREGLPAYRRIVKTPTTQYRIWAISESALTAWELAKGQMWVAKVRARAQRNTEKKQLALTG